MKEWMVRLPYTRPPLNDNDRMSWQQKHRVRQQLKGDVFTLVKANRIPKMGKCSVNVVYVPRDNRRRDTDNLSATRKVAADAVVQAGVVPDDTPEFMEKPEPIITSGDRKTAGIYLLITQLEEK